MKKHIAYLMLLAIAFTGCRSTGSYQSFKIYNKPMIGEVAQKSIEYEGVERNPVIVIPGIFGSRLIDPAAGKVIWGEFATREGIVGLDKSRLEALSLPMEQGKSLKELKDELVPDGPIDKLQVQVGLLQLRIAAYSDMLESLRYGGYYDEKCTNLYNKRYYTCFPFGYDWRRDIVENAAALHLFILEKRKYLQEKYEELYGIKDYDVQFDIVAHSMGGLIARYYLRYGDQDLPEEGGLPEITWRGANFIDKIIIVGTPNGGYVDALTEHVNGLTFTQVGADRLDPAVLGTFPSLYEMMPVSTFKCFRDKDTKEPVDIYDPSLWTKMQWGIVSTQERGLIQKLLPMFKKEEECDIVAFDHLTKCLKRSKRLQAALAVPVTPPDDIAIHLWVGDAIETSQRAEIDMSNGKIKVVEYGPGDGKVLSASATYDTRLGGDWEPFVRTPIDWTSIHFSFAAHMGITKDPHFIDNILYILLATQTKAARKANFNNESA